MRISREYALETRSCPSMEMVHQKPCYKICWSQINCEIEKGLSRKQVGAVLELTQGFAAGVIQHFVKKSNHGVLRVPPAVSL